MPAMSYKREEARVIYSSVSSKTEVSKYKSQVNFLDTGNAKFSAVGCSHLDLNTSTKTQKPQIKRHQVCTPDHPGGCSYNHRKTTTFS